MGIIVSASGREPRRIVQSSVLTVIPPGKSIEE